MAMNGISPRKKRAIAALLAERNIKAAALAAHVGERSLLRWLASDPEFRAALVSAEDSLIDHAGRRLLSGQDLALDTLEKLIGGAENENNKRLAAVAWLDLTLRIREIKTIESRLAALEAFYYANKQNRAD